MGKKGSWFASVKKALTPDSQRGNKLKKTCLAKTKNIGSSKGTPPADPTQPLPPRPEEKVEVDEEESRKAYSVALATAAAAKAVVAAADAALDVVRLTNASRVSGKLKQEMAAIKIQTTFRGYVSRRALRALRGLVRLKTLIQGQSVKCQSSTTLCRMQSLARVQSQIRLQRFRMCEENQTRQQQAQQKQENNAEVEAKRQEAAMRREKALAYASSRQQDWKNLLNPSVMDPNNPHRGWKWMEDRAPKPTRPFSSSSVTGKVKTKSKPPSPRGGSSPKEVDKRSKKRLSYPLEQTSTEQRRLSGPPKLDISDNEKKVANGGKRRSK